MDIFERMKRYKAAKDAFIRLPVETRTFLLRKYTRLTTIEIVSLSEREQAKIIFSIFYSDDNLVRELLKDKL